MSILLSQEKGRRFACPEGKYLFLEEGGKHPSEEKIRGKKEGGGMHWECRKEKER